MQYMLSEVNIFTSDEQGSQTEIRELTPFRQVVIPDPHDCLAIHGQLVGLGFLDDTVATEDYRLIWQGSSILIIDEEGLVGEFSLIH